MRVLQVRGAAIVLVGVVASCSSAGGGGSTSGGSSTSTSTGSAGGATSSSSSASTSTSTGGAGGTGGATSSSSSTGGAGGAGGASTTTSGTGGSTTSTTSSSTSSSTSSTSTTSTSSSSSSTTSTGSGGATSMGGGSIPVVADGCGVGGTVAWTYTFQAPIGLGYAPEDFQLGGMVAGPMGHIAVGSSGSASNTCNAPGVVLDASGTPTGGLPTESITIGACTTSITPVGFDPQDHVLYGYERQNSVVSGPAYSGFQGEMASASVTGTVGMGPIVYPGFMGADTAGNLFALVNNTGPSSVNFGLGPVAGSGTVLLHYDPSGTLVSQTLPIAGKHAVGALGGLFSATQVNGTLDDGCGAVGSASTASTVLTKRNGSGTCLWSKALPPNVSFAVDPMENVLLATTFNGTITFGGSALTSAGTSDLAIAKLDPSGAHLWSKRFGAAGSSVSGISALGAVNDGGEALSVNISGAVDFGCGMVSSSGGHVLFARFDATGSVIYSRVVQLLAGFWNRTAGPVVDGLGGISYAAQLQYQLNCACTNSFQCPTINDQCIGGMCQNCGFSPPQGGNILISRFAP